MSIIYSEINCFLGIDFLTNGGENTDDGKKIISYLLLYRTIVVEGRNGGRPCSEYELERTVSYRFA